MTQPTRVGTILYLFYTLLCHAATYLASVVKQAMRQIQAETFAVKGPMLVTFAAFVVLGLLWAGERPISLHASRGAVIAARLVGAAVQTWLGFGHEISGKRALILRRNRPDFLRKMLLFAAAWVCGFAFFAV